MTLTLLCAGLCIVTAAAAAPAAGPSSSAASQPASAAMPGTQPATLSVLVQVRFGDKQPGVPAKAQLQIAAMGLDVPTDDQGELVLPKVPKGKVALKVFVPGADACTLDFDAGGDKPIRVKLFVPKRGLGSKCTRLAD